VDYENRLLSFSRMLSGLDFKGVDGNEAILPFSGRFSAIEIGSFEVVSKIYLGSAFTVM
jgi:hypothetical protein